MPFRNLDADHIINTAELLNLRVTERFPDSGLAQVASELVDVGNTVKVEANKIQEPFWSLRIIVGLTVLAGMLTFIFIGRFLTFSGVNSEALTFVQSLEAGVNTLILGGLGLAFLFGTEERFKRKRVLKSLHMLRSITHVIDMHQLTKDPNTFLSGFEPTHSSPERRLTWFELIRYLDYASEMLSLCGKLAALYAQSMRDQVVMEAVNDIETLSTNLSRKIWQKIVILETTHQDTEPSKTKKAAAKKLRSSNAESRKPNAKTKTAL